MAMTYSPSTPAFMPILAFFVLGLVALREGEEVRSLTVLVIGVLLLLGACYFTVQLILAKVRDRRRARK